MKRKIEMGCLIVLWIVWAVIMFFLLCAAEDHRPTSQNNPREDTLFSGSYSVIYRPDLRIPTRVWWSLDVSDIGSNQREPSWRFSEDTRVGLPRATHNDYTNSGFDRGHMVPAADRSRSLSSMKQTFLMTNVCPQVPRLNRGAWKSLENACRRVALNGTSIRIVTDAVFWQADTQRIGKNGVAVPHGFVKTVYSSSGDSILYSKYYQNY